MNGDQKVREKDSKAVIQIGEKAKNPTVKNSKKLKMMMMRMKMMKMKRKRKKKTMMMMMMRKTMIRREKMIKKK